MTHPLLRVVCCYGAGVAAGMGLELTVLPGFIALAVLLLALVWWPRGRAWLLPLTFAAMGWLNLSLREAVLSADDIRLVAPEEPVLADVRGRLTGPVRLAALERAGEERFRSMAELEVESLHFQGQWHQASGRIVLSAAGVPDANLYEGCRVQASGVLARPAGPRVEGLFDYRRYLALRGIHHQLLADTVADWLLLGEPARSLPLPERFTRWAGATLSRGLPSDDPATGLIQAMTLGWKTALTDEVEEPFMKSGTMHIFAISGLHVALMAGMLLTGLRLVRLPRALCGVVAIPLLWFYVAATGWQSSAVRATVMMSIILGGWVLRRPSDLVNSLAAAALLILLLDPRQLFQASFQLSFVVVLALALILPPLEEGLLQRLQPDPLLPRERVPRWRRWLGDPLHWMVGSAATSLAAWLGSMPITASYFHLFSPGTLLANLLLVPCGAATLASAVASLVCGAWWPWMSETFNHGAWFWMRVMMAISEGVARVPGSYWYVPAPWAGLLLIYYGTMLFLAFGWCKGRSVQRLVAAAAGVCVVMVAVQGWWRWQEASATMLPLHGGMGIHVKPAHTWHPLLVDCGHTNAWPSLLNPHLQSRGVNRIRALFLTHGEALHVGAALALMEALPVEELVISPVPFRSTVYRRITGPALPSTVSRQWVTAGDQRHGMEVLHPPRSFKSARADDGVMVLRFTLGTCRLLLVSDLSVAGQRKLLEQTTAAALRAEVVVTGLPDTGEPLIPDLLEAVQPHLVIVVDDDRPPPRRAPEALLERLKSSAPAVLSTRQTGAVKVSARGSGWVATGPDGAVLAASGP